MSERPEVAPEDCPEPFWHNTHRYCPVCTWTEERDPTTDVWERAEIIMRDQGGLEDDYAVDGLMALKVAGWSLVPPEEALRKLNVAEWLSAIAESVGDQVEITLATDEGVGTYPVGALLDMAADEIESAGLEFGA